MSKYEQNTESTSNHGFISVEHEGNKGNRASEIMNNNNENNKNEQGYVSPSAGLADELAGIEVSCFFI